MGFVVSPVPKGEAVKCRDMVYRLSLDILYIARVQLPLRGLQAVAIAVTIGASR
jgi:hypothetical protein